MNTKERILYVAKVLFSENGYEGVSIREIAHRAEVAVSAINYHFDSKENLFSQLLLTFIQQGCQRLRDILAGEPKSVEEIRSLLELFACLRFSMICEDLGFYRLFRREQDRNSPFLESAFNGPIDQLVRQVVGFVRAGVDKGLLHKNLNVELFVNTYFLGLSDIANRDKILGPIHMQLMADEVFRKKYISDFVGLLLDGCLNKN